MCRDDFMDKNYNDQEINQEEQQDQNHAVVNSDENPKTETNADIKQESEISPSESQSSETDIGEILSAILPSTKTDDVQHEDNSDDFAFASEHEQSDSESLGRPQDDEDGLSIPEILPVLPLKEAVIYPFSVQPLAFGQDRYIRLVDDVMRSNRQVVLVAQKSPEIDHAGPDDIFKIGTVARVGRMFRMPDGTVQIAVQGLERVSIDEITEEKPYLMARVSLKPDTQEIDNETEAIKRNVISYFQRLVALVQNVPEGVAAATLNLEEPRQVVYVIATFVQMDMELRQQLLELDSVHEKLKQLSAFLAHELEILELGKKIQTSAQEEMGKMQREYLLREQLKAIQRELGEESEEQATITELLRKIEEAKMPEEAHKEATRELARLEKLPTVSPEYSIIRTYIELLVSLPWSKTSGAGIDVPCTGGP